MQTSTHLVPHLVLALSATLSAQSPLLEPAPAVAGWTADAVKSFDRTTVYAYMDGAAEVYIAYGMKALHTRIYRKDGELPIDVSIFDMDAPSGAYGAFSFERVDEEAGIGQGSEYGGGILRYWHGHHFVFIQAQRESEASREAVMALGRQILGRLGEPAPLPTLVEALDKDGLRAKSLRYIATPGLLYSTDSLMMDNALGLPDRCEAVVARYGKVGRPDRVILARFPDGARAIKGLGTFLRARTPRPWPAGTPIQAEGGWCLAGTSGVMAVLVLDAPDAPTARKRYDATLLRLKEVLK